jgi:hypothetical protein
MGRKKTLGLAWSASERGLAAKTIIVADIEKEGKQDE